jgi:hypothetical protein
MGSSESCVAGEAACYQYDPLDEVTGRLGKETALFDWTISADLPTPDSPRHHRHGLGPDGAITGLTDIARFIGNETASAPATQANRWLWSCRESNPSLYQAICLLSCRFAPSRSGSVPLVTCGFVLGS